MRKAHDIAGEQQIVRAAHIVEAHADGDHPARQVAADAHQRVDVLRAGNQALAFSGSLQPWRADPPQHERTLAHPAHEAQRLQGLLRKTPPYFRPRQEFEDLGVVVQPEPIVAADQLGGFGGREKFSSSATSTGR